LKMSDRLELLEVIDTSLVSSVVLLLLVSSVVLLLLVSSVVLPSLVLSVILCRLRVTDQKLFVEPFVESTHPDGCARVDICPMVFLARTKRLQ
jgi:hypothetical protein